MKTPALPTAALLATFALTSYVSAEIRWTGTVSRDAFDEANWDFTQSSVTSVEPDVSIDDDVVVALAGALVEIPSLPMQQRFQLAAGRTLTLDGTQMVALGDDGVGGAPGSAGVSVRVIGGASFEPFFVVNGTDVDIDANSTAVFRGGGNPVNGSTIDLSIGSELDFLMESPADFLSEHLGKITVDGAAAVAGQNLSVVSDGSSGCRVRAVAVAPPGPADRDDDLLSDDDETLRYFTDPDNPDTDGDGSPDGFEVSLGLDPLDALDRAERPNVVFILVDDLGWGDLGVLYQNSIAGPRRLRTPSLDRMAAEGALLTRHYCPASVCAPSRASLLTGVHQGHATVRDNQFDKALESSHNIASTLRRSGYATAHIGKYGLQGNGNSPATWPTYPTKIGFDSFFGYVRHGDGHNHYPAHDTPARPRKQVWWDDMEVSADLDRCYTTDLWTARAKDFVADHVQTRPQQPFFLYLCHDTPHAALQRPTQAYPPGSGTSGGVQWTGTPGAMINTASGTIDSYVHPDFQGLGWSQGEERFATIVRRLDAAIGDMLDTLEDLGIAEDTLVVLTSDNGPHAESYVPGVGYQPNSFDSFGPFDGIKRCSWEGGVRVPTIAWWPQTIPAGRVDDTPTQFHDWMTTLNELAGWTSPARSDGISLMPLLTGTGTREEGIVYVEYQSGSSTPNYPEFNPSHRGRRRGEAQVIFEGDYKGIRVDIQDHNDPFEIYDVASDPRETNDLRQSSAAFSELEARMRDRVLQLRRPEPSASRPYDSVPVPAAPPSRARPGLSFTAYEGFWPWLPEFASLQPVAAGATNRPDVGSSLTRTVDAGLLFEGFIDVPATGDWTFTLEGDGGALLRLHDIRAVDGDVQPAAAPSSAEGTLKLAAGLHPVRLYYRTGVTSPSLQVRWSGPGTPEASVPASAWYREDTSVGTASCVGQPNSTGAPGRLYVEGSQILIANDVVLAAEGLRPGSFGFFLASLTPGFTQGPGGSQGDLCLGGAIGRFVAPGQVLATGPTGRFSLPIDLGRLPTPTGVTAALSFQTWYFQAWHRDTNPGATSNFTAASMVTFF